MLVPWRVFFIDAWQILQLNVAAQRRRLTEGFFKLPQSSSSLIFCFQRAQGYGSDQWVSLRMDHQIQRFADNQFSPKLVQVTGFLKTQPWIH